MKGLLLLLFTCFCINTSKTFAQHEADNWYFGHYAGLSFSSGSPSALSDGQLYANEGCAAVSDKKTGELLFYTDGATIWNGKHQIMDNGTGLKGGTSSTQSALIVPNPANKLQYYVFTSPDLTSGGTPTTTSAFYSIVSMEVPFGTVISKNNFLIDSVAEKLTGTIDCDGTGFWIVTHHVSKSTFYSFHLTSTGLNAIPTVSSFPSSKSNFIGGCMKISPNSSKIAVISNADLSLFDFDASTGNITNYIPLNIVAKPVLSFYGLTFSPDNTKLYASRGQSRILQYEINLPDSASICNSEFQLKSIKTVGGGMQIAPDGRIYISEMYPSQSRFLSVIENPNLKGDACIYRENAVLLTDYCVSGLTYFMDYIFNSTGSLLGCALPKAIAFPDSNCAGKSVLFVDHSKFNPTSREWTFENGTPSSSTDSIVSVTYSQAGTHRVRLVVKNDNGSDTAYTNAIIFPLPVANAGDDKVICPLGKIQIGTAPVTDYTYSWSPVDGLDNPAVPNPIASPYATTTYKVIVANTHCIDSDFVTVSVSVPPFASAGSDTSICSGKTALIGTPAIAGNSYSWNPATGLANPNAAVTVASPNQTTPYILTVTNSDGCVKEDTVTVGIFSPTDGIFTLNPPTITILPGQQFQTTLHVPGGVQDWLVWLEYDQSVVKFSSIVNTTNGIAATISKELTGKVSIQGSGNGGDVILEFNSFLPYNLDSVFAIMLSIDSSQTTSCVSTAALGNTIDLGEYCSKKLRRVNITGKYFFVAQKEDRINFGVGLQGRVRLELYDYTGTLKEVLTDGEMDAGEYSIDLDLPVGVYFCRINVGIYNEVQKIMVVKK